MTLPDVPWTCRAFSPLFMDAPVWLRQEFEAASLSIRLDSGGNLIGTHAGRDAARKPITTGSHCDTVMGGGRFDGIIGVLAGIEVAHILREQGIELAYSFEVIDFLSEEPSDYGISCVGSRSLPGMLDSGMLAAKNAQGETLAEGLRRVGDNPDALNAPLRGADGTAAFVELHIEQGPVLETRQLPIGVVTNIVGIRRVLITVEGQPDHAGTTPMNIRRDALVGASRVINGAYLQASAASGKPHYVVATVGCIAMTPNAPNAVPSQVELLMEVRSDSNEVLDTFPEILMASVADDLKGLRLTGSFATVSRAQPTDCSPLVMSAVKAAADQLGYASMQSIWRPPASPAPPA